MPFEVFDYRTDRAASPNFFIAPEIRARFLHMQPGHVAPRHCHDLGHEIFLVLEGHCEFEIEGHREVLGPGQACVARVNEYHQVRPVGDEPVTMYLSVTPHVQPSHTFLDAAGKPSPPRYAAAYAPAGLEAETARDGSTTDLVDAGLAALQRLATAAQRGIETHGGRARELKRRLAADDKTRAKQIIDDLWVDVRDVFRAAANLGEEWNALAAQFAEDSARR